MCYLYVIGIFYFEFMLNDNLSFLCCLLERFELCNTYLVELLFFLSRVVCDRFLVFSSCRVFFLYPLGFLVLFVPRKVSLFNHLEICSNVFILSSCVVLFVPRKVSLFNHLELCRNVFILSSCGSFRTP